MRHIISIIIIICSVLMTFAQGNLDTSFNSGFRSFPAILGEEAVDIDTQDNGAMQNTIVVAYRKDSVGEYTVRRYDKNNGSLINARTVAIGGNAYAGAMTVRSGGNQTYVAGSGVTRDVCTVVKFMPNLNGHTVLNLPLPSPLKNCRVTDIQIRAGKIYVLALTENSTTANQGLTVLRINQGGFTFDSCWKDTLGINGLVRTEIPKNLSIVNLMQSGKLAFVGGRIFASGLSHSPTVSAVNGTIVAAYPMNLPCANLEDLVSSGFGYLTKPWVPGKGIYYLPKFMGDDMVASGTDLYLLGRIMGNPNNYEMVRLASNAVTANSETVLPAIDFGTDDFPKQLITDNLGNFIGGGNTNNGIALAKYTSLGLINSSWTNPGVGLWTLPLGLTPTSGGGTGDRRILTHGSFILSGITVQSTNKMVGVGLKKVMSGSHEVIIFRVNN